MVNNSWINEWNYETIKEHHKEHHKDGLTATVKLDSAIEHASHAWAALCRDNGVGQSDSWPPQTDAPVGSSLYHFAAMIMYVQAAYELMIKHHPEAE